MWSPVAAVPARRPGGASEPSAPSCRPARWRHPGPGRVTTSSRHYRSSDSVATTGVVCRHRATSPAEEAVIMPSVLITGAGRGIGEATALRLARAGWTVFAGVRDDLSRERLAAVEGDVTPVLLDITDETHIAALADLLPEHLDAVVNNAGIGVLGPVEALTLADIRRQFEVNLFGQVAVTQAVLPRIRAAGGRIVFISSTGGRAPVTMEGDRKSTR